MQSHSDDRIIFNVAAVFSSMFKSATGSTCCFMGKETLWSQSSIISHLSPEYMHANKKKITAKLKQVNLLLASTRSSCVLTFCTSSSVKFKSDLSRSVFQLNLSTKCQFHRVLRVRPPLLSRKVNDLLLINSFPRWKREITIGYKCWKLKMWLTEMKHPYCAVE